MKYAGMDPSTIPRSKDFPFLKIKLEKELKRRSDEVSANL